MDPSVKAYFVNTDAPLPLSRQALKNGSRITNLSETNLATQLVESLITTDVASIDIGIITFYCFQLALVVLSMSSLSTGQESNSVRPEEEGVGAGVRDEGEGQAATTGTPAAG